MLWLDHLGKEVTSAQTEEARQSRDLFSISSRVKLGKERLQGISCVAMSHDRKSRLESAMKVTGEFGGEKVKWLQIPSYRNSTVLHVCRPTSLSLLV